jgi:4-alpha-glucanotransferase
MQGRSSGLLLHPTSLPGREPCGTLGPASHAFADFLADAGQSWWQVLPLGPTGFGDSPYQCFSAFAGQPLLVSCESLVAEGLLPAALLPEAAGAGAACAYGAAHALARHMGPALADALATAAHRESLEEFRARSPWLADYSRFMAIRESQGGSAWTAWPAPLRTREPDAMAEAARTLARAIAAHDAMQWAFDRQWRALRAHAHAREVRLFGDAPIFVAHDSADVWSRPELFDLDERGECRHVAGVPPDYFSDTGQLWGNPLYRWDAHAADGFAWWRARVAHALEQVDLLRLDHFIGFVRHWEIPAGARDAREGRWRPGPGEPLFRAIERDLGSLPLVAEDLGETGADVEALRDQLGLPGMRVMHFAFGGDPKHPFLPVNFPGNTVAYTGTHDNDTTRGWWERLPDAERAFAREQLGESSGEIAWDLMRAGWGSRAALFVAPVQDALSLGSEARLNTPGRASGNWTWRLAPGALEPALAARLREATRTAGRLPG